MTSKPRFSITVSDDVYEFINTYQHEHRLSTQTMAISAILSAGIQQLAPDYDCPVSGSTSSFGQNLKRIRESRGLSQAELARLLNTSRQNINRYEKSGHEPTLGTAHEFARALNVSLCDLAGDPSCPRLDAPLPSVSPFELSLLSAYHSAAAADRTAVEAILSKYAHE